MKKAKILQSYISAVLCAALICAALTGCASLPGDGDSTEDSGTDKPTDSVTLPEIPQASDAVSGEQITTALDGTITLEGDSATLSGTGLSAQGPIISITSAGTYGVSGTLNDGQLVIDTEDTEKVKLILNGASLNCSSDAAIYVASAPKKVIIYTQKDSVNLISDGTVRAESDDIHTAAIYSKDDLKLDGEGTLYVTGNYAKGIFSKDDLEICGGSIYVSSADDGIRGKDSVSMTGGYVVISAGADGLRSSNDTDSAKGYISISGGELYIEAAQDGIQAETTLTVSAGKISVVSGGGAEAVQRSGGGELPFDGDFSGSFPGGRPDDSDFSGSFPGGRPDDSDFSGSFPGGHPDDSDFSGSFPGGRSDDSDASATQSGASASRGKPSGSRPSDPSQSTDTTETGDSVSKKGLKAGVTVLIESGEITVDAADDAIHSSDSVTVNGGTLTLSSGDDGIHADATLSISGGNIAVERSYEGLEGLTLNISGGTVTLNASDDGLNAAGGTTTGGFGGFGRPGGSSASDENGLINITGGDITVNADGDGIDSNGNIRMSGGNLIVFGPTSNGDGALDFDGSFTMSGGTLLALGSSGMAQRPTGSGEVGVLSANVSISQNSEVSITDSSGRTVIRFTAPKRIASVIFAASGLAGSYSINVNGTAAASATAK